MSKLSLAQRADLYFKAAANEPVKPKTIYYHAYRTCIMSCSPFAIFQELITDESFSDYEHVWVYGSDDALEYDTFKRYSNCPNVKYVKTSSEEQAHALATCQYLITNAGLPSYWRKRQGQTLINTWHGTPLKTLGKDARDFMGSSIGNAQRNFLLSDYLVMPNRYTADRILDSYCIDGMFCGKIIDAGAPRVDLLINSNRARTLKLLETKLGASLEGKKVVLYAPTFRSSGGKSVNTTDIMAAYMKELVERAPEDCVVFFKVHNTLGKFFAGNAIMKSRLIFDEIETNELLGITDVLITDYSSIFFDFICTEKPVLFFTYDLEHYSLEHGMYMSVEDMPGTECTTVDEVISCLGAIGAGNYRNPNQEKALKTFAYRDDGKASKRVVDIIFRDTPAPAGIIDDRSAPYEGDKRTDVLISLANEPVLSAAQMLIRLLRSFDPQRHRVTIAAHNVHLIWRECRKVFPEARIIFADIESASKLFTEKRDHAFYTECLEMFFPHMSFDEYYNLKQDEGFLDDIIASVFPNIAKHWRICWSEKLGGSNVARRALDYADCALYCSHRTNLPKSLTDAPIKIVTDTDIRNEPDHIMNVLMVASFDSTNYALAACARQLVKRGHRVTVSINNPENYINTRMFLDGDYETVALKSVDDACLVFFDMVVGSPLKASGQTRLYRHILKHNLLLFSFCNLFSSVSMRINPDFVFTLGEAKNEELRRYNLHYNCVAIGNPQYDDLLDKRKNPGDINKVLIVEQGGYPYGEQGKRQLADMILRMAKLNPSITFDVKPRYLPSVRKGLLHGISEHVYDYLTDCPANLNLMAEHSTIEDIIGDYDAMITMWSTAFLDAMMMDMPLLLVGGFDSVDVFDVRSQRINEAYDHLRETGCLRHFDEIGANIADEFCIVDKDFAKREVYGHQTPAADRVVRFLELAFDSLVKPNLRIDDDFSYTEQNYYRNFSNLELVDADSTEYQTKKKYRNALNAKLQEYVYLNRCMGSVLDLTALEAYYQKAPTKIVGKELDDYIKDMKENLGELFEVARDDFFNSAAGMAKVETDRVLQDFYFDWLFARRKYSDLKNPPLTNLLAPESREYNLARLALKRMLIPAAYDHLFKFLRIAQEQPIVQLLKVKRIQKSLRPFKRGPLLQAIFFSLILKEENQPTINLVYKTPEKMPIVALQRARTLNKTSHYEECVVFCDAALLHNPTRAKERNLLLTGRKYLKKAFFRGVAKERAKAYNKAEEQAGEHER